MREWNPLVASGQCERVYACEVKVGNITAWGDTVTGVHRLDDKRVFVTVEGHIECWRPTSTMLIRTGVTS